MRRGKHRWMGALLGAAGVALLILATPVGFIETLVASSGLSEALPAAAPPLGMKARLLMAGFGALMAVGLISARHGGKGVALLTHAKEGRRKSAPGVSKMGFALSKLNWLGRNRGEARANAPALRRADAHPDAPARSPIFASRDFGGLDIFARTVPGRGEAEAEAEAVQEDAPPPAANLSIPSAPEAGSEEGGFARLQRAFPEEAEEADYEEVSWEEAPGAAPLPRAADTGSLSLAELTERLERGLAQRKRMGKPVSVIADMPIERAVPVRERVEEDADQALRAALGTLRNMAGRRG